MTTTTFEYETITVHPLTTSIGAEIEGLDLSRPLDNRQAEEFHRAFLEHQVIFLRGQAITPDQQKAIGRMFGELCSIPYVKSLDGHPEITEIIKEPEERKTYNFGGAWHTDMSFLKEPALASILYGLETPDTGGDTKFASTRAAYDALSPGLQRTLESLSALHAGAASYGNKGKYATGKASAKSA